MKPCVLLLSGGIDSATTGAILRSRGFDLFCMSFSYGQRHIVELECASKVARHLGATEHRVITIDLAQFGGSALTADIEVPKDRALDDAIPITYVPARNTVFLSYALAWSEVLGANDLGIGVTAVDYSGYPDCRPEFIQAYESMANLATKRGVEGERLTIHTPLIDMSKRQIIQAGLDLGMDYSLTTSCYDPASNGQPCGHCDSCLIRNSAFAELGLTDPLIKV